MMKQLGSLESQMKQMKEEMSKFTATGSAGAGLVEVTVNGDFLVQKIEINPVMIDKEEKGTLEVLIQSAFNDAINKLRVIIEEETRRKLQSAGLPNIPGFGGR